MSRAFGGMNVDSMFPSEETLVINRKNNLIKSIIELNSDDNKKEDVNLICEHVYDLAMMSHKQLNAEQMTKFIERSNKILERIAVN